MSAKVTVKGIVGLNPELIEFDNNTNKKAKFSVASGSLSKGQPVTTWYNVEAWNGNTNLIMYRIQKGQLVEVTGRLRLSLYRSKKHKKQMLDATVTLESFKILPKNSSGTEVQELTA